MNTAGIKLSTGMMRFSKVQLIVRNGYTKPYELYKELCLIVILLNNLNRGLIIL